MILLLGRQGRRDEDHGRLQHGRLRPHPSDLALGGKNDLRRTAGKRSGDRIVFEFVRRLDTNDKFDKPVPVSGDLKLIWACGESDDFESHHIKAGSEILNFSSGEQSIVETSSPHFLFFHAGFMLLAIVFMACGFAIARYQKRKKWWLYMHKALGAAAVVSATAGIGSILVYVTGTEGEHFGSPHGITGAVAFLLSAATLTLGVAMFQDQGKQGNPPAASLDREDHSPPHARERRSWILHHGSFISLTWFDDPNRFSVSSSYRRIRMKRL
jgi:hypothetical protein